MKLYLLIAGVLSILVAWIAGPWCSGNCLAFYRVGELSATLFAVIGVWLSLAYRDEIITNMWHGEDKDQARAAKLVCVAYSRCELLFRGFLLSTVAFIASFFIAMCLPWGEKFAATWQFPFAGCVVLICRYILSWTCPFLCLLQLYSLFVCVSPMRNVVVELRAAKRNADRILANIDAAKES